jgi:hypothetical protein
MAKAKAKKKKKKHVSPPRRDHLSRFGMLKSDFITLLLTTIPAAESGGTLWGTEFGNRDDKAAIGDDISRAFVSMFRRQAKRPRPEPDPGTNGSATKLLAKLITDHNWPENPGLKFPKSWDQDTFRNYEIACAVNILMAACNAHGPGGPPDWPPEKPH